MKRNTDLLSELRPLVNTKEINDINSPEWFQNTTLRPIIKFQHELLICYIRKQHLLIKSISTAKTNQEEQERIASFIQKQSSIKNLLIGMIIGLFTNDELDTYFKNQSEFNRRIIQMICQRLFDSKEEWIN